MPATTSAHTGLVRAGRMVQWEARVWALSMLAIAYWTNLVRIYGAGDGLSLGTIANAIIGEGAFDILAWVVVFESAGSLSKQLPASGREIWQALVIGAICALPTRQPVAAGMLMLAFFLYAGGDRVVSTRRISVILSALAFEIIWTSSYLDFMHVGVAKLDARLVAALYRGLGYAASARGNVVLIGVDDAGITILAGCASSFILAGTGIAFVATAFFRDKTLGRSSVAWLFGSFLASIVLTELRLALMARSDADYDWWHTGPGVSLYSLAATASVACFSIAATRRHVPGDWPEP